MNWSSFKAAAEIIWQQSERIVKASGSFLMQRDFQIEFWSSILSTAVITGFVAIFVKYFTPLYKTPKLVMVVKQEGFYNETIKILRKEGGNCDISFRLAIKNNGSQTLRKEEGYWHVYFPGVEKLKGKGEGKGFIVAGESNHLRDMINTPLYPRSFLDIGPEFRFSMKEDDLSKFSLYYFFETNYGYFPKTVSLDQKTGAVLFKKMGSVKLDLS